MTLQQACRLTNVLEGRRGQVQSSLPDLSVRCPHAVLSVSFQAFAQ